jgi:hypothetical protein
MGVADMDRPTDFRTFLPAMYPVAALLVVSPLAGLVGLGWPIRPAEAAWRFGSLGLGFGTMATQILGVALAMLTAAVSGHRRALRSIAFATLVVSTVTVAAIARFLMDYGQLRAAIPPAELAGFDTSTLRALISATLAVPVLLTLGARAWAWPRTAPSEAPLLHEPIDLGTYVIPFRQRQPR